MRSEIRRHFRQNPKFGTLISLPFVCYIFTPGFACFEDGSTVQHNTPIRLKSVSTNCQDPRQSASKVFSEPKPAKTQQRQHSSFFLCFTTPCSAMGDIMQLAEDPIKKFCFSLMRRSATRSELFENLNDLSRNLYAY